MTELIRDLALSILMAWLLGVAAHLFRQPLILAYLVAGVVLGPTGLQWVKSQESIRTIAELGLIFMLFMIGLEIDLKKIIQEMTARGYADWAIVEQDVDTRSSDVKPIESARRSREFLRDKIGI